MSEPISTDDQPAPGEDVIYEYEAGKLIEARVLRRLTPDQFEIAIPPAKSRWAIPYTKKGTWEDGATLVVSRSALRRFGSSPFDEGDLDSA